MGGDINRVVTLNWAVADNSYTIGSSDMNFVYFQPEFKYLAAQLFSCLIKLSNRDKSRIR